MTTGIKIPSLKKLPSPATLSGVAGGQGLGEGLHLQIKSSKDFRALHYAPLRGLKNANAGIKVKY